MYTSFLSTVKFTDFLQIVYLLYISSGLIMQDFFEGGVLKLDGAVIFFFFFFFFGGGGGGGEDYDFFSLKKKKKSISQTRGRGYPRT